MNNKTIDLMIFFCKGRSLSKARLAKMIYWADWKYTLKYKRQITDLEWVYDHYGPYLNDFYNYAKNDNRFVIHTYGNADMLSLSSNLDSTKFSKEEMEILNEIKSIASNESFKDFLKRIYATYPIRTQPQYSKLNLVELAEEYNRIHKD